MLFTMSVFCVKGFIMSPGQGLDAGLEDMSPTQQKLIGNRQLITDMSKLTIILIPVLAGFPDLVVRWWT